MNAFDWIELLMKGAVVVFLIFCLPWIPLAHLVLKPYPYQLEPFEYFAYGGSMPKRWVELEAYTCCPGLSAAGKGWLFYYSDNTYEFVSKARLRRP